LKVPDQPQISSEWYGVKPLALYGTSELPLKPIDDWLAKATGHLFL